MYHTTDLKKFSTEHLHKLFDSKQLGMKGMRELIERQRRMMEKSNKDSSKTLKYAIEMAVADHIGDDTGPDGEAYIKEYCRNHMVKLLKMEDPYE